MTGNLYDVTSGTAKEFTSSRVSKQVSMYNSDKSATTVSLSIPTGYELKYSRTDSTTNDASAATSRTWQYANSNHNLKVYVAKKKYKITTTVTNGTIDASCEAEYGSSKTISYKPKAGYKLKSVTVDGVNVTSSKPNSQTFSSIAANHTVAVVYEPITVPFSFTKTNTSGTVLSGATFQLKSGSTVVKTVTSSSAGKVDFGSLGAGTYTLTETSAPAGYVASSGSWTVTVNAVNSTVTVAAASGATAFTGSYAAGYKLANAGKTIPFSFTKTDGDGAALSGAVFKLAQGSTTVKTVTSTSAGKVDFGSLGAGTYTLTETSAPAGYVAAGGSWTVTVNAVSETVSLAAASGATAFTGSYASGYKLANKAKEVPFSFTKTDDDGAALAGAKFKLTSGSTTVAELESGSDGTVDFGSLRAGTYTLTEVSAPAGYTAAGGSWTVTVNTVSETVSITAQSGATAFTGSYANGYELVNVAKTVRLSFTKTDGDGAALSGAVFALTQGSTTVKTVSHESSGLVDFGELRSGTYTLAETAAPTGYVASGGTWTVEVDAEKSTLSITSNDGAVAFSGSQAEGYKLANLKPLPFSFTKVDGSSAALAGASFELKQGDTSVQSVSSGSDGKVDFGTLNPGSYQLYETAAPAGYDTPVGYWDVVVGSTVSVTPQEGAPAFTGSYADGWQFANTATVVPFSFTKTNGSGAALAGATFQLKQGDTVLQTVTSASADSSAGLVDFGSLGAGTYALVETEAPSGYAVSSGYWILTVDAVNKTVSVVANDGATDFTGSYADGYTLANQEVPIISVTKEVASGYPSAGSNVAPGSNISYKFTIKNTGKASAYVALRDYKPEGTRITTYSAGPNLISSNSNAVTWGYTVEPGSSVTGIEMRVKVLDTAPSVIRNVGLYEVGWDGSADPVNETNEIVHYVPKVPFSFSKIDSKTNAALAGASFMLVNQKTSTTVKTVASDDNGKVDFGEIASGTYTMTETPAPKGYTTPGDSWTVVVDAEQKTVSISAGNGVPEFTGTYADGDLQVANDPLTGTFNFTKVNVGGVGLEGAGFELSQGGTTVAQATSGADGTVSFTGLAPGTYDLRETAAPAGYALNWFSNDYYWTVTLEPTDDGKSVYVTSIDSVAPEDSYAQPIDFGYTASGWTLKNYEPLPFSFKKVDEDGNPIANTYFTLENAPNSGIGAWGTGDDGVITLHTGFTQSGTYKLRESMAASGYEKWTGTWNVNVDMEARTISISIDSDAGGTAIDFEGDYDSGFTLVNKKPSIPFTFTKVDENDNPLPGAEFLVEYLDVEGQTEGGDFSQGTSDENGLVEFDRGFSQPGTYLLSEQVAPAKYDRPASGWKITVAQDATTKALSIASIEPTGDDAPLFAGNYTDGYTLTNALAGRMPFSFTKTGADGNELQGATFELRRDGQVYATLTSDEEGWVDFGKLDAGDWTLVETAAPAGYADPVGSWTVSVNVEKWELTVTANDGATAFGGSFADGFTLENEKEPVAFTFNKADSKTGTLLSGAKFSLTSASGAVASAESGVDGSVSFADLADGTYTLAETAAPAGYNVLSGTWTVVVDSTAEPPLTVTSADGARAFTGSYDDGFTVTNDAYALPFSFTKTDAKTGAVLSGASFTLDRGDGTVLSATSDASGKVDFGQLDKEGYYTLSETAVPDGYECVLGTWNVYVDIANRAVDVHPTEGTTTYAPEPGGSYADGYTIANTPDTGTIAFSFKKSDQASDSGLDLENASFAMYTCVEGHTELSAHTGTAGSTTSCWKLWKSVGGTDHTGSTYDFGKLTPGTSYMLVEEAAPGGYHDADGDWHAADYELPSGQWLVTVPATATSQSDLVVEPCENGEASADWNFGNAQAFSGGANSRWVVNEEAATEPFSFTKMLPNLKTALPGFTFALYECTNPSHSGKDSHSAVAGEADSCWGSYDDEGQVSSDPLVTAVSGADGKVDFGNLKRGYYMLVETAVPASYTAPNGRTWEFEKPAGQLLIDFDSFFGVDAGAGDGAFFIPQEQREGTGLSIETGGADAPKNVGCAVVNTPTNLTDEDKTTNFTFTKVGDGDAALQGATFELYACGDATHTSADAHSALATNDEGCCWDVGTVYATATSGADGVVSFTGLASGQYMMVETVSPSGYRRPYGQWMLDVDAVGGAVSVKARGDALPPAFKVAEDGTYSLPNYRNWTMPLAGAGGAIVVTAAGAALVAAAVAAFVFSRRRGGNRVQ